MKIGVFDSGLGGLLIAKAIRGGIPDIDLIYMGDTLNLPYGSRSENTIYECTRRSVEFLFEQDCALVIIACNTASVSALRRLQQEYLPKYYPDRRILGVVVPTIEAAVEHAYGHIGVIGTEYTIGSGVYREELSKIKSDIVIEEQKTPLLVPMIEHGGDAWLNDVLDYYLDGMRRSGIDALLLGCTHYVHLKERVRARYDFDVLSQDEVIPAKLAQYLDRHEWLSKQLSRDGTIEFYVSDYTDGYQNNAVALFGAACELKKLEMSDGRYNFA